MFRPWWTYPTGRKVCRRKVFPPQQAERRGAKDTLTLLNTCSDLLLPIKPYILEFPELSKTVPPAEDQAFNTWAWGSILYHNTGEVYTSITKMSSEWSLYSKHLLAQMNDQTSWFLLWEIGMFENQEVEALTNRQWWLSHIYLLMCVSHCPELTANQGVFYFLELCSAVSLMLSA